MSSGTAVTLTGSLGLRDVVALADRLAADLGSTDAVVIDCSALTGVDLSIVQVLVSAARTARAAGRTLTLQGVDNEALSRVLVAAGFVAADGTALTSDGQLWTKREAQAA